MTNIVLSVVLCLASWQTFTDKGKIAANGKPFDPSSMSCASRQFPLGTHLRVTDIHNKSFVDVVVTDKPHKRFKNRIDLSPRAFKQLNGLELGVCGVSVFPFLKSNSENCVKPFPKSFP
jgi:rare lipoprotein A